MPKTAIESLPAGPDPAFPHLSADERFTFPDPLTVPGPIVAAGGNLSPGMLLSAYSQGLFPWFNPDEPVLWQSPDPRFIITPENLHISASMKKVLARGAFAIRVDHDFPAVIRACAAVVRPEQSGTWITPSMIDAYAELNRLGLIRTAESYLDGRLVGGCYGLHLGRIFFGESMFSAVSNASKAAFLTLAQKLFHEGAALIDCQVPSDHLRSLGGKEIPRRDFLKLIKLLI